MENVAKPARAAKPLTGQRRRQERAELTRQQLIRAARQAFAKRGFEHANIADIAANAGKTRGAFYANFKDKEDVFFAIFEEDLKRDQEKISRLLRGSRNKAECVEALSNHMAAFVRNSQQSLLCLEFKMYAIRRPHKRARLAELHAAMCQRLWTAEVVEAFPKLAQRGKAKVRNQWLELVAAMDGLALNLMFAPETWDEQRILQSLRLNVLEAIR